MPEILTLKTNQKKPVTVTPADETNAPTSNFNPATWQSSNSAVCTIANVSPNGLQAEVIAQGVGSAVVTVTGQQGDGLPQYSSTLDVEVTAGLPVKFLFEIGAAEPK